jgi:hypothetical protein
MAPSRTVDRLLPKQEDEVSICVGCGLCCNGTYLAKGNIESAGEAKPLTWYKAEFFTENERTYFRIPCPHFSGQCCSIYEDRFAVCRSYRCGVLTKLDDGEIRRDEAEHVLAEARRLIAKVAEGDPGATKFAGRRLTRRKLARALKKAEGAERTNIARRLLNIITLDSHIERWFLLPKKKKKAKKKGRAARGAQEPS